MTSPRSARPEGLPGPTRLSVTSETAHIARVRTAAEAAAADVGFTEAEVAAIGLAVGEAVANVIQHGYDGRTGQPIDVTIEPVARQGRAGLQVIICDSGRQVDPSTICGRDLADVRPGGLGTHIMGSVMDEVEYTRRKPAGMQLRLVKMLAPESRSTSG